VTSSIFGRLAGASFLLLGGLGMTGLMNPASVVLAHSSTATQQATESTTASAASSEKTTKSKHKSHSKHAGKTAPTKTTSAARDSKENPTTAKLPSKARKTSSQKKGSARSVRLRQAFIASAELRPMAQQLATMRTPEAYAAVSAFARRQSGEAQAAAYLALGHAYLLDKHYSEATANLREARKVGEALADYVDFLSAQAEHEAGNDRAAEALLAGFNQRYPDSIFNPQVPELEATVLLALNDPNGARRVLAANPASATRTGYQFTWAEVERILGEAPAAERDFKHLLMSHPLSSDALMARARLAAMGADQNLTASELRTLGDAYYNAGRYAPAAEQYHALARRAGLDASARNGFAVAEAACDLKLKRLTQAEAEALDPTQDENGARRLYLLMELARNRSDLVNQRLMLDQLKRDFPQSEWLAEALFSSGNMYMLRHETLTAIADYSYLATHFPAAKNAASAHWRAGWLSYRQALFAQAASLFDEQIKLYPSAKETVSALYWRGRLYENLDRKPEMAATNYRTLTRVYPHFFYAQMARKRLVALGKIQPAPEPQLDGFVPTPVPQLDTDFPDSPHLATARLLANAGMNDYIALEIAAAPGSGSWSALAEAKIYQSFNDPFHAMRVMKRAVPGASSAPIRSIPLAYWRILFPQPWWDTIKAESSKNNLDPYLVASLIRQESEFNPAVVSHANAYGLMQMLPSVGKSMAHEEGLSHFQTFQLLNPETNIRLGTRYLRETLAHFGGVQEYALAAYNAGGERVSDWQANGPYQGIDEFVESIPFTETREYVQAILRNREIYQAIDEYAAQQQRAASNN